MKSPTFTPLDAPNVPAPASPPLKARIFETVAQNKPEATLIVMGLVTLIITQSIQGFPEAAQQMVPGLLVLGIGMLLLGAQAVYARQLAGWVSRALRGVGQGLGVHESQVIFLAMAGIYAVLAARTIDFGPVLRAPGTTIGLWVFSMGLVLLAGWRMEAPRWGTRQTWLIVLGLTGLAFVVRGVLTAQYPPNLTSDEASMGLNAVAFIEGKANNIFNVGWYSFPAFFYYLESL
jgi:hypothetical protein